jgi:hypothetical protein
MIEFIRRWHRFGGGSARDIFVGVLLSTSTERQAVSDPTRYPRCDDLTPR